MTQTETWLKKEDEEEEDGEDSYEWRLSKRNHRKGADTGEVLSQSTVEMKKAEESGNEGDALIYKGQRRRFGFREVPLMRRRLKQP